MNTSTNMEREDIFGMETLNYNRYLPNTEQRLRRLGKLVKKPVCLLLPGPSIYQLENRIGELGDVCYATVNDFWIFEEKILSRIDRKFDIVLASADECGIPNDTHIEYLERGDDNIFISSRKAWGKFDITKYDDKLLFFETDPPPLIRPVPTADEPLTFRPLASFALLLVIMNLTGAKDIFLFGADGGYKIGQKLYYEDWPSQSWGRLSMDTRILNENFQTILARSCSLCGLEPTKIWNVSPNSMYECFEKINYEEAIKRLIERP